MDTLSILISRKQNDEFVIVDRALRFILIRVNQNNREQCSDTETGIRAGNDMTRVE